MNPVDLVDSHNHLDAIEFDRDREQVLERARVAGVRAQVVCGTDASEWPRLRWVCAGAPDLFPVYGLHPTFLELHRKQHLDELQDWIRRERPVAVGECGLDYFVEDLDRAEQSRYFEAQLMLAKHHDLPVIVHARRAVDDVISAIRKVGGLRGVVHSFSGSRQQAERLWEQDFMLGLGGPVTYDRANRLRELAATMPLERLLLETDSPDQVDSHNRGRRNEPARLVAVLEAIASLRGEPVDRIAAATTGNARRLFQLPRLQPEPPSEYCEKNAER